MYTVTILDAKGRDVAKKTSLCRVESAIELVGHVVAMNSYLVTGAQVVARCSWRGLLPAEVDMVIKHFNKGDIVYDEDRF